MTPLQLLLVALASLARGRNQHDLAEYLELTGALVDAGRDSRADFGALRVEIEDMVASGRDPTPAERHAVRERRRQLSEELRSMGRAGDDPPVG